MTPDMKRLVQAVKDSSAPLDTLGLHSPKEMDLIYGSPEAIVRAVLTELREVGEEPLAAGAVDLIRDIGDPWDAISPEMQNLFSVSESDAMTCAPAEMLIRPNMKRAFGAMIDTILAEPATA